MKDILPYVAPSLMGLGLVLAILGVAIEANRRAKVEATPPFDARGRLLVSRKVILAGGAFLGIGGLLMFAPGMPTFGQSDWWAGAFFGFLLCYFIHLAAKLRRSLAATRKPEAKT